MFTGLEERVDTSLPESVILVIVLKDILSAANDSTQAVDLVVG